MIPLATRGYGEKAGIWERQYVEDQGAVFFHNAIEQSML